MRLLLIIATIAQMTDVATTVLFLKMGYVELNPLFGPKPSTVVLILTKLTVLYTIVILCHGRSRCLLLIWATVVGFGAAIWNLAILKSHGVL